MPRSLFFFATDSDCRYNKNANKNVFLFFSFFFIAAVLKQKQVLEYLENSPLLIKFNPPHTAGLYFDQNHNVQNQKFFCSPSLIYHHLSFSFLSGLDEHVPGIFGFKLNVDLLEIDL